VVIHHATYLPLWLRAYPLSVSNRPRGKWFHQLLCAEGNVKQDKQKTLDRLARLGGQVRGVARMVEEDRYCVDILTQTAAIRSALKGVERLVLENHAKHCVEEAIDSGNPQDQREKFNELIALLQKTQG
jgi:DNA-binding FrmR family transcriptional regulator